MNLYHKTIDLREKLAQTYNQYWLDKVLFSIHWWILVIFLVVPWFIWWQLIDKKRFQEIVNYCLIVMIIILGLDEMGVMQVLWSYPYRVFPSIQVLDPMDVTVLPVIYSLLYFYIPSWKRYLIALVVFSLFASSIFGWFLQWIDYYDPLKWKGIYGLPIYFAIGVVGKAVVSKFVGIENTIDND